MAARRRYKEGQKYGRVTLVSFSHIKGKEYFWNVICDCGTEWVVVSSSLGSGHTKSCGCYHKEVIARLSTTHGMARTRTYRSWYHMKDRCSNPKADNYIYYGGRGIDYDPSWEDFEGFFSDMGVRPPNRSLDRIDNSEGYSPSNCRWATRAEQASNRRTPRQVIIDYMNLLDRGTGC